jgi:hypothetical protein
MSIAPRLDESRKRVWMAFAEHFLDTETRQELPQAALAAVEAGFSVEEAREIWCYEVTPAVGANLWSVAGEWAGWDEEWLVATVAEAARRRRRPPGIGSYLAYRATVHFGHASWVAIERLMKALLAVDPAVRKTLASDLAALASHYFDFVPRDLGLQSPGRRDELKRLYVEVFLPALRPTVFCGEGESAAMRAQRMEEALR